MGIYDREYMKNRDSDNPRNVKPIQKGFHFFILKMWKITKITITGVGLVGVVVAVIAFNSRSHNTPSISPSVTEQRGEIGLNSQSSKESSKPANISSQNNSVTIINEEKFQSITQVPEELRVQIGHHTPLLLAVKYKRTVANGIVLKKGDFEWVLIEKDLSQQYIRISPELWRRLGPYYPNLDLTNPSHYVK